MSACSKYRVNGRTVILHDEVAERHRINDRVGSAPCFGDAPKPGLREQAKSYVAAELSLLRLGQVKEEVLQDRLEHCRKCPRLKQRPPETIGYCGACGCGFRPRAALSVKATMPAAQCPIGKWGQVEEGTGSALVPEALRSAVSRLLGR
jgi:hypothetical protein